MKQERTIFLSDGELSYTLDRGKRTRYYLCIRDGHLTVRAPKRCSIAICEDFIKSKQAWIREGLCTKRLYNTEYLYENGEIIDILGEKKKLTLLLTDGRCGVSSDDTAITAFVKPENIKTVMEDYFAAELQSVLDVIVPALTVKTGLVPNKVTLRKMTASFGRCHSNGNIVLSKKLVHYPVSAIEYVVLHELCHIKHMNHSKDFWGLVESFMPDFRERRRILKQEE